MGFILFLLILAILLILLLALPIKVRVCARLDGGSRRIDAYALRVVRVNVTLDGCKPNLSVYLFNNRIYKTRLGKKKGKKGALSWLKCADIGKVKAQVSYGMKNPFATAIAGGALGIASRFIHIGEVSMRPDFSADSGYIRIDASAEVALGNTIVNIMKKGRHAPE